MTEVLDARETRLVAVSRENGELLEVNAHLKRYITSYMKKSYIGICNSNFVNGKFAKLKFRMFLEL